MTIIIINTIFHRYDIKPFKYQYGIKLFKYDIKPFKYQYGIKPFKYHNKWYAKPFKYHFQIWHH